jgi:hypothetical protein
MVQEWVSTASTLTNGLQSLNDAQTAKKIRDLDKLHLSDKQYAARKKDIEEEQLENNRKLARANQLIAIATAVVNISEAITKGMSTSGNVIIAALQAGAYAAMGAIQVATIEAQNFSTGRGLVDILSNGRTADTIDAKIGKGEYIMPADKTAQNIDELKRIIFERLRMMRVYTKPRMDVADLKEPMMMRTGATIEDACARLHRDLARDFKYALVWGKSAKFPGQKVGIQHILQEGDIFTIVKKQG